MEVLLQHPSGYHLYHSKGQLFDLRWFSQSLIGPFALRWEYSGSHGQKLELDSARIAVTTVEADADGSEVRIEYESYAGARSGATFRLTEAGLELRQQLTNERASGAKALELYHFCLNASALEETFVDGLGEDPVWRFFPTAYNSFSPSFVRDSRAIMPTPRYPTSGEFNQFTDSIYWTNWSDLSTQWMATLHRNLEKPTLLLGFLEARVGVGEVALRRRKPHQLEARLNLGGKVLQTGEMLEGDTLRIAYGQEGAAMVDAWVDEVAKRMEARVPDGPVPAGWCSWYYYYTKVSEGDVLRNLKTLEESRSRLPIQYVQLDDGYQRAVGDWLIENKKFPAGLRALVAKIKKSRYIAGIWTAPFVVQRSSLVFRKHPDWLLKDEKGQPKRWGYHPFWGIVTGQIYSLDPSHPEVLRHLEHIYTTLVDYGIDYFKIDFLNAGLREGHRYDSSQSPLEAFRQGIETIRKSVGERYVLGCGAPLMPCIGVVDGMRISSDVKESWRDPAVELLANGVGHPAAELAVLNCITRSHLHQKWWTNDPDCLLVRDSGSSLRLVEVQTLLSVLSLTGGILMLSDDLSQLSRPRRELAEAAIPPMGETARAIDLFESERPELYVRSHTNAEGDLEALAAVINWTEKIVKRRIRPEMLGLPEGNYHLYDYWKGSYRLLEPGTEYLADLDPHETALVLLRPARNHPQLITATHHMGQTTTILEEEYWNSIDKMLTIDLSVRAERDGHVWVSVPEGFRIEEVRSWGGADYKASVHKARAARIRVPVNGEGRIEVRFGG